MPSLSIQFTWLHRTFMLFGKFKEARTNQKLSMDGYEKCPIIYLPNPMA